MVELTYLKLLGLWRRRDHRYTLSKAQPSREMARAAYIYRIQEAEPWRDHSEIQRELGLFAARWGL